MAPTTRKGSAPLRTGADAETCGLVVSLVNGNAAASDVPVVRALTGAAWKKMELEIEWGFESGAAGKDYSGRIETYDGVTGGLRPLAGDTVTEVADSSAWRSFGQGRARRGVQLELLYLGTSQRKMVQPYASQREDVSCSLRRGAWRGGSRGWRQT